MRRVDRKLGRAGFSVVEAIVAAGVIAAGILALTSLFPVSSDNLVASAGTTAAVTVGSQKIEELRNVGFPPAGGTDNKTVENTTYTRTWTVTGVTDFLAPNRRAAITVTVTWPGRLGTLTFTSMIAE
jgi:Tfp pilus assembly protein PilV